MPDILRPVFDLLLQALTTSAVLAALAFVARGWFTARVQAALHKELEQFSKRREQAVRVAEYLTKARRLGGDVGADECAAVEALGWELAMWLPADIYRSAVQSLARDPEDPNARLKDPRESIVAVRKILLGGAAGDLKAHQIAMHEPGIAKRAAQATMAASATQDGTKK